MGAREAAYDWEMYDDVKHKKRLVNLPNIS